MIASVAGSRLMSRSTWLISTLSPLITPWVSFVDVRSRELDPQLALLGDEDDPDVLDELIAEFIPFLHPLFDGGDDHGQDLLIDLRVVLEFLDLLLPARSEVPPAMPSSNPCS